MLFHKSQDLSLANSRSDARLLGSYGHLALFIWSMAMVLAVPLERAPLSAGICLLVIGVVYPGVLRRLLRLRWLALIAGMVGLSIWWASQSGDWWLGVQSGLQMAARSVVILAAADGFSGAVDISEVAGLFERFGLHGLGFSMGVAINLLPSLRQSSENAWRSLWMRGGLRRMRWRALKLFTLTVISNALRRAEEVALAAEARAFSPDRARAQPIRPGRLDGGVIFAGLAILLVLILWG